MSYVDLNKTPLVNYKYFSIRVSKMAYFKGWYSTCQISQSTFPSEMHVKCRMHVKRKIPCQPTNRKKCKIKDQWLMITKQSYNFNFKFWLDLICEQNFSLLTCDLWVIITWCRIPPPFLPSFQIETFISNFSNFNFFPKWWTIFCF